MDRGRKVELFEEIRREHVHGSGSIRAVAKKLGVHRRMVRQALASAIPPERKLAVRNPGGRLQLEYTSRIVQIPVLWYGHEPQRASQSDGNRGKCPGLANMDCIKWRDQLCGQPFHHIGWTL